MTENDTTDTGPDTSLYAGLQKLSGARFVECNNAGDVIDADILRSVKDGEQNIALPSAGNTERDKFHGAIVFDPQPGRHRNVFYLDFASLYPNAMRDMNASPDTLIGGQRELIESKYSRRIVRWGWVDPRPVKQLDPHELYSEFTDGQYKMVYDPDKNSIKWRDDWGRIQDNLQRVYYAPPADDGGTDGFLPERADTYIRWNNNFEGTMYSATKRQRNCFTDDTEVLTPDGIRNIRELSVGDMVYSIDPDTLDAEVKPVTATHEYPDYDGDVIHFENEHVDFVVTPNHRMLVSSSHVSPEYWFFHAETVHENDESYLFPKTKAPLSPSDTELKSLDDMDVSNGVYCVTVADNHTLMAGRNKKFQWVGQSLYGVSGDTNFRLFDWRVAESITIFGRRLLEQTGRKIIDRLASQFDRDNLYITHGDTDGIGIAIDSDVDIERLLPIVKETVAWLEDNYLDDYLERTFGIPPGSHHQAIDIETFSPTLLIPEDDDGTGIKKTYAERVTYDEGESVDELDVTGFELVRSDIADVTEVVQSDVLESICYADPESARQEVYERVRKAMSAITDGDTPLEDIVLWQGLSKDPSEYGTVDRSPQPPFRGANYANQFIDGESISAGDSVAQVYVARIKPTSDLPTTYVSETAEDGDTVDTIAVTDPSNIPSSVIIDREKHARKTVIEPLESIFRAMDWDFDAARVGQTQQSLTEF